MLGSGDFVDEILREAGQVFESQTCERLPLEDLIDTVAKWFGVPADELGTSSRKRKVAQARSVVTYVAIRNHRYKGTEIAKALSLSSPTVSQNIDKGKILIDKNKDLKVIFQIT